MTLGWSWTERLREPSSWGGLAMTILGLGQLVDIEEAPIVADAAQGIGAQIAETGALPGWQSGVMIALGLAMTLIKERGARDAR